MQRLVYFVAASLDGFIARRDHTFDCFPDAPDSAADYFEALNGFDVVVMGRRTYDIGLRAGVTDPYPKLRTYVFSRAMLESPDPKVTLVREDAVSVVRDLKSAGGRGIYLCGGGQFATELLTAGLVDEVRVKLHPFVLGQGVPLFDRLETHVPLVLRATKPYPSGVVVLRYDVSHVTPAPS